MNAYARMARIVPRTQTHTPVIGPLAAALTVALVATWVHGTPIPSVSAHEQSGPRTVEKSVKGGERVIGAGSAVDLKPRPLGMPKEQTPAAGRAAEGSGSAGAVLWSNPIVRTTGSLAIVLGLILLLAAVAKRASQKNGGLAQALGGGSRPAGIIEVLGRYPIARGQTLILLKVDRRVLLLGQTAGKLRGASGALATLCEIEDAESVASILGKVAEHEGESHGARFQSLLHAFDRSHTGPEDEALDLSALRKVAQSAEGVRAELWDDQAVVHKFPVIQPVTETVRPAAREMEASAATGTYAPTPTAVMGGGSDSYSAIRQRLSALKGEAHR